MYPTAILEVINVNTNNNCFFVLLVTSIIHTIHISSDESWFLRMLMIYFLHEYCSFLEGQKLAQAATPIRNNRRP